MFWWSEPWRRSVHRRRAMGPPGGWSRGKVGGLEGGWMVGKLRKWLPERKVSLICECNATAETSHGSHCPLLQSENQPGSSVEVVKLGKQWHALWAFWYYLSSGGNCWDVFLERQDISKLGRLSAGLPRAPSSCSAQVQRRTMNTVETSGLVLIDEDGTGLDRINAARVVPEGVLLVSKQGEVQGPTFHQLFLDITYIYTELRRVSLSIHPALQLVSP